MTMSGRQKHELENVVRAILWEFAEEIGLSNDNTIRRIISQIMERRMQDIVFKVQLQPDNHGKLGALRGYIRKRRRTPITRGDQIAYDVLTSVLSATKLLMNGENILATKRCDYRDKEESYYCGKEISYGFRFCWDHWQIMKHKYRQNLERILQRWNFASLGAEKFLSAVKMGNVEEAENDAILVVQLLKELGENR